MLGMPGPASALSGSSSSGNATAAQYNPPSHHRKSPLTGPSNPSNPPGATPASSSTPTTSAAGLPFTGYAVLSAVAIGLGLLSIGLVVRRRAQFLRR